MLSKKWVFIFIMGLSLTALVVGSSFFPGLRLAPTQPQDSLPQSITVYAYGPNGLLSKQNGGETSYYHTDHLSSSALVTDSEGKTVYRSDYEPFGDSLHTSGEERYTYTGKERDASTGLYYYGARYYDFALGRFISSDPLSGNLYNSQRLNRYTYVMNNPMVYTDPTGMEGSKPGISPLTNFIVQHMHSGFLNRITSGNERSARAMARYLSGTGEPMTVELTDYEWNGLISHIEDARIGRYGDGTWEISSYNGFKPFSDVNHPQEERWEIVSGILTRDISLTQDVWNLLGETSIARRSVDGGYEYSLIETFDFVGGTRRNEESVFLRSIGIGREVSSKSAKLINFLYPDVTRIIDTSPTWDLGSQINILVDKEWIINHGKPIPLIDRHFVPMEE